MSAGEIERHLSTERKLAEILPAIMSIPSPKGTAQWQHFVALKELRDGTIHLKELNQYVRGEPDQQSIYHRFLNTDPLAYPRHCIALMKLYLKSAANTWLTAAEAQLEPAV
jgi:hypothetical protein